MILEYLQTYEWQKWNFHMISVKFTHMGTSACSSHSFTRE